MPTENDTPAQSSATLTIYRGEFLALMALLDAARLKDVREHEATSNERRSMFCDGGASRLNWAIEELRQLTGLKCDWRAEVPPPRRAHHRTEGGL